jgi:hypothetical protein
MNRSPIATVRSRVNSNYLSDRAENDRYDRKRRNKAKRDENRPRFIRLTDGSAKEDWQNGQRTWRGDRENASKESE